MPSFDEVCATLHETKVPPLGLLAAVCCARAARAELSAEDAAPFVALDAALIAWGGTRRPEPQEIATRFFAPCLAAWDREPRPAHLRLALDAAREEMAALGRVAPRSLSDDGLRDLGVADFTKLAKACVKQRRTSTTRFKAQLEELLAAPRRWPALVEVADRMPFGRVLGDAAALPPQLEELVRLVELGATWSWSEMGGKHAIRLALGTTKRTAVLDDEARTRLLAAVPWLT